MPFSFYVFAGLLALLALIPATLKLAGVVLGRRRALCPACNHKQLAMTGGAIASRSSPPDQSATWAEYQCDYCNAQFVKLLGTGLMTRQAWIAGAKEPIPTAIVVVDRKDS